MGIQTQQAAVQVMNNSNYGAFSRINNDIATIINSRSMVSRAAQERVARYANPTCAIDFGDVLAMPVASDKNQRIQMYRQIAQYPICRWCLDEIADDFIHDDENKNFITLTLPQRLNSVQQEILQNEFKKFMNLFKLRDDGFNLVKRFLTEGELAWENIINPNYPDLGIIGVKFLPAEYYDTLINAETGIPIGIVFDVEQFAEERRQMYMNSIAGCAAIFNTIAPTSYNFHLAKDTCVPLLWNQVTYVNSGEYSNDYMISYPLIENAKQQYHRLALLEDSAVILRVTHAPERLLFNVSTGKMTQNYADEYVRRFAMELKSKKVAAPNGRDIYGTYSPPTMLKSYVFGKSDGNEGTQVQSVGSSATYDQMDDIEYFLRQLIKQFKVPWTRYKTPENTMEKNDAISYEEYAFSRMIMRFQRRFADGFKKSFITHLKLRDIWDKDGYDLLDSDIQIEFVKPVLYDLYEMQKLVDAKMTIYKAFADQDEISKITVMRKYLGMSDKDIEDNFNELIREKQLVAIAEYYADQVTEENPPVDFKSPVRLKKDVEAEEKAASAAASPKPAGGGEGGGEDSAEGGEDEGGEDKGDEEESESDAGPEPAAEASFGLG